MKKTLNVGCGSRVYKEYPEGYSCINLDNRQDIPNVDVLGSVEFLPFSNNYFNYILASDIIEHFPISKTLSILLEWFRVLKSGGILELRTPDMSWAAKHYTENKDAKFVSYHIFGGQDYIGNFHYVMFDSTWLTSLCVEAGFIFVSTESVHSNFILKVRK